MTRNHRLFKAVPIPTHVRRLAGSHYVKIDSSNSVGVIIRFGRLSFYYYSTGPVFFHLFGRRATAAAANVRAVGG